MFLDELPDLMSDKEFLKDVLKLVSYAVGIIGAVVLAWLIIVGFMIAGDIVGIPL